MNPTQSADVRALTRFAKRVVGGSEAQCQMMVLGHGAFPPDVGRVIGPSAAQDYRIWSRMLKQWAEDYLRKARYWSCAATTKILGIV